MAVYSMVFIKLEKQTNKETKSHTIKNKAPLLPYYICFPGLLSWVKVDIKGDVLAFLSLFLTVAFITVRQSSQLETSRFNGTRFILHYLSFPSQARLF